MKVEMVVARGKYPYYWTIRHARARAVQRNVFSIRTAPDVERVASRKNTQTFSYGLGWLRLRPWVCVRSIGCYIVDGGSGSLWVQGSTDKEHDGHCCG